MTDSQGTSGAPIAIAAAAIAVSAWGLSGVVAKAIDIEGIALAGYRFTLFSLVVGALMTLRGARPTLRILRVSMWGGISLAVDAGLFFTAVKLTTVANVTIINALQPVFVAVIAWRMFGERIARRDIVLATVALAAVVVVVVAGSESDEWSLLGDVIAFFAVIAWAAYFVFSKQAQQEITSNEYTIGAAIWTGLVNLALAFALGQDLSWPSTTSWIGIIGLAFGAGILGHGLMNWSIKQVPLWLVSTMTLLIPVVSAAGAWIWLGEDLNLTQIAAMAVVLSALAGIVSRQGGIGSKPRPLRR